MKSYLDILQKILNEGEWKENRTGIDSIAIAGAMFEHDMSEGFPLLTTKKVPTRLPFMEMEFFIKGITDKTWLRDRNNRIWDEWATPDNINYTFAEHTIEHDYEEISRDFCLLAEKYKPKPQHVELMELADSYFYPSPQIGPQLIKPIDEKLTEALRKLAQYNENDLGPIYGWQWRHFGAEYKGCRHEYTGEGIDQLSNIVHMLKTNPNDRRMIATAWNPVDKDAMGLPPCHHTFQVIIIGEKINLLWMQRSVDTPVGLPFNIAEYGLLLHLLALESGYKEGKLIGQLADTHIYKNQLAGVEEQLSRKPFSLPQIETSNFTSIFDWKYTDTKIKNYESYPKIDFGHIAI